MRELALAVANAEEPLNAAGIAEIIRHLLQAQISWGDRRAARLVFAASTADQAERIKLYREVVDIYQRVRPFLFLYNCTWFWVTSVPHRDGLIRANGM
jgi:hypothetical protein